MQQAASARRLPPPLTKIEADFESGLMREIHHENPGVNLEICRMYARRMIEAKRQYQAQAPAWVSQSR